ncbi:DUF2844 domain-containing protein [Undibacterium sp.]|uniref:DUF2844 domain-containing protein n=1 Tax=Undibacterium sp. TaxID=1914977 RepID=UPI00374D1A51
MRIVLPLLLLSAYCSTASAALGGAPTDFGASDSGRQLRTLSAARSTANYHVSESTLSSGTVVREYVASSGTVFAVSWSGPFIPDLQTLLGKHAETLNTAAARKPKAGNSQLSVTRPDVVIQSGGHMRAYQGRAWVPAELPGGVTADDIQ